jgi:hypothetical protein
MMYTVIEDSLLRVWVPFAWCIGQSASELLQILCFILNFFFCIDSMDLMN